jgi:hypothetical protein
MKTFVKPLLLGSCFLVMLCADLAPDGTPGLRMLRPAEAIIGLPFTPLSFAGVARRSAYRSVVYSSAAVAAANASAASAAAAASASAAQASAAAAAAQAAAALPPPPPPAGPVPLGTVRAMLPPGCVPAPINGIEYQDCAGTFYRAAFQGSTLVYVATKP